MTDHTIVLTPFIAEDYLQREVFLAVCARSEPESWSSKNLKATATIEEIEAMRLDALEKGAYGPGGREGHWSWGQSYRRHADRLRIDLEDIRDLAV